MTDWTQFNPIPRGAYPCEMRRWRHKKAQFVPSGPVYAVGDVARFNLRKNPRERIDTVPLTARLFEAVKRDLNQCERMLHIPDIDYDPVLEIWRADGGRHDVCWNTFKPDESTRK